MRVKLENAEIQLTIDGDLANSLETLARIEAGQRVLAQKVAMIEAALAKIAATSKGDHRSKDPAIDEMVTMANVVRMTGLSKSTLWRMQEDGTFPMRINLGDRRVGWPRSVVETWREERKAA